MTGFEIVFFGMLTLLSGYTLGFVAGEWNERLRSERNSKEKTPA